MGDVLQLKRQNQRFGPPDGWHEMFQAPKDGTPIRILVASGPYGLHRLPYLVCWDSGRWCYATFKTPLFSWHAPKGWQRT